RALRGGRLARWPQGLEPWHRTAPLSPPRMRRSQSTGRAGLVRAHGEVACCYIASSSIGDLALGALSLVPCPATVYDALTPRQGCTRKSRGGPMRGRF